MTMISRATARVADRRSAQDSVRILKNTDLPQLSQLLATDRIQHAFVRSQMDATGGNIEALGGARILGRFDSDQLVAACWLGANIVPVTSDHGAEARAHGRAFGRRVQAGRQRYASIFGPEAGVEGVWDELQNSPGHRARSVRTQQPLMTLETAPIVEPAGVLRRGFLHDFDSVWPASVAMFTEELGYSPLEAGEATYRVRVKQLLGSGHVFIEPAAFGTTVPFKAELGVVTADTTQVQGVWMHPDRRGLGLAASRMADVVVLAQHLAPVVSLYVNDYNTTARSLYERVGFHTTGTFATVLF